MVQAACRELLAYRAHGMSGDVGDQAGTGRLADPVIDHCHFVALASEAQHGLAEVAAARAVT